MLIVVYWAAHYVSMLYEVLIDFAQNNLSTWINIAHLIQLRPDVNGYVVPSTSQVRREMHDICTEFESCCCCITTVNSCPSFAESCVKHWPAVTAGTFKGTKPRTKMNKLILDREHLWEFNRRTNSSDDSAVLSALTKHFSLLLSPLPPPIPSLWPPFDFCGHRAFVGVWPLSLERKEREGNYERRT